MPITARMTPGSDSSSTSMPPSLSPSSRMSFGHFRPTPRTPLPSRARATAMPTASDSPASRETFPAKRQRTEKVRPVSGEDSQLRPRRPRPAVCRSATSNKPVGAPCRARSASRVLVEPHSAKASSVKRPRARPSRESMRSGSIWQGRRDWFMGSSAETTLPLSPIIAAVNLADLRSRCCCRARVPESCG
jgi:hypothetical protein